MIVVGKRKRLVERIDPARERSVALKGECRVHGVRSIYDLPVGVLYAARAERLRSNAVAVKSRATDIY